MTKGIKVWVAHLKGEPQIDLPCFEGDGISAKQQLARTIGGDTWKWAVLEKDGWTVEPYTLTKGHGDE